MNSITKSYSELTSGSEHLGLIVEWLKNAMAEGMGEPVPVSAYIYCRLDDSDPDFKRCQIILMDARHAIGEADAEKAGWITLGPAVTTSPAQISAFTARFSKHFTEERYEFWNRYVVPDERIAFGISVPKELADVADSCIDDIAYGVHEEWLMLFKHRSRIAPNIQPFNSADVSGSPVLQSVSKQWAAMSKAGLLFYPHVQILPHSRENGLVGAAA